jgi:GNAT superfamily N-acetyltransferase
MTILVRQAVVADADEIGRVHVRAWQAAYEGLMPDDYLASLNPSDRADMWRSALGRGPRPQSSRFVVEMSGNVVGFAIVGPIGGDQSAAAGELHAINLDPTAWGSGAGRTLHAAAVDFLVGAGFRESILWVHPDNARARRFYEREGWVCDDITRVESVLGVEVPEVRYSRLVEMPT